VGAPTALPLPTHPSGLVFVCLVAMIRALCFVGLTLRACAQIRVMAPEALVSSFKDTKGRIEGSTATFGAPFYGERILGRLVYGDSKNGHTHCMESDYDVPAPDEDLVAHGDYKEVRLIHIVLVRRGKCSFVTKVKVARKKGAHAVIIVDKENSALTTSDIRRIIVADDGYGDTVDIPSLLISRQDGQQLIDFAKTTNNQVIVEMAWDVPTNHVVIVDLWMSSASRESQRFLKDFSVKRKALNEAIKFVPHYHVFGMQSATDYNHLCTSTDAQFCAEDPDGSGPITGRDVVEEDIRQLCIHEVTKIKRINLDDSSAGAAVVEYAEPFWQYVETMPDSCPLDGPTADARFGKACSETLMGSLGIDIDKVKRCVRISTAEKLRHERENIAWSPRALRINGWRYSGTLDADLVTRAICAGFVKQPDACGQLLEPVDPFKYDKPPETEGVGLGTFVMALLAVAAVTLAGLLLYKRSLTKHIHTTLREEVMLEVQAQMDTYKQLPS